MKALRSLLYAAIGLAVLIGFRAMLATELVRSREAEIGHARRNAENLALALEGQARATVQRIDQVLVEARYRLQPLFAGGVPTDAAALSGAVTADLTRWLGMIPEAQSLRVSGSDGSFVFDAS